MNSGILQTTLTRKSLELELEYRPIPAFEPGSTIAESSTRGAGQPLHFERMVRGEFECLLSVI
jgi:hypothetical protein